MDFSGKLPPPFLIPIEIHPRVLLLKPCLAQPQQFLQYPPQDERRQGLKLTDLTKTLLRHTRFFPFEIMKLTLFGMKVRGSCEDCEVRSETLLPGPQPPSTPQALSLSSTWCAPTPDICCNFMDSGLWLWGHRPGCPLSSHLIHLPRSGLGAFVDFTQVSGPLTRLRTDV